MKAVTAEQLEAFLASVSGEFDVRVPVALHDGTRTLGALEEGSLALVGGPLPNSPLSPFFPQFETTLTYREGSLQTQAAPEKPLLVVGLTAEDA